MEGSRILAALAAALSFLSLVERAPAFVPVLAERAPTLRGGGGSFGHLGAAQSAGRQSSGGAGLQTAAALLALSAAGMGTRNALRRRASDRASKMRMRADGSYLQPGGPVIAYMNALMDAAAKKEESVLVTKDVMKVRKLYEDEAFLEELLLVQNTPFQDEMDKASGALKLFGEMSSTVMPKYVTFLAKKRRLIALKPICQEYITTLYSAQEIVPVRVKSAERLGPEQLEKIKAKMEAKTGASDIKLVQEIDASLLGGFIIEYGFVDPDNMLTPTDGIDLSFKSILTRAAIGKGVIIEL